jgi:hypothetical protein
MSGVEGGTPVDRRYDYVAHRNLARFDEAACTLHYDDAAHPDRLAGITVDGRTRFDISHDSGGNLLTVPGQQLGVARHPCHPREARRALKRHLVRRIWHQWQACWPATT